MKRKEATPTETPSPPVLDEDAIQEAVADAVRTQVARALTRTGPIHNCAHCDRLTDSDSATCRRCQAAANEASAVCQIAHRMGYVTGWPENLLDILDLPEEELLQLNQDELAAIFRGNVTQKVPARVSSEGVYYNRDGFKASTGQEKINVLEWKTISMSRCPETITERVKREELAAAVEAELQARKDEARLAALEAHIEQKRHELDRVRQEVEGRSRHAFRRSNVA